MGKRETKLMAVTGQKRVGKSYRTIQYLTDRYINREKPRKVLVFDTNGEYGSYELKDRVVNIKMLGHKDILRFSAHKDVEIRRVVPIKPDGFPMMPDEVEALLLKLISEFRGGCLFIDDLNKIFGDNLPKQVSGLLTNNAHRNADIIFHVQSIGRLLPKMHQNIEVTRFHRQHDGVDESKGKLGSKYEIYKLAELIVRKEFDLGNERYYVYIDHDNHKIQGKLNADVVKDSVYDYVQANPKLLRKYTNYKDKNGKKKYTHKQALVFIMKELLNSYF